jgi:IS5 family transposase
MLACNKFSHTCNRQPRTCNKQIRIFNRQSHNKDIDARWTEKNKQKYYGYKYHTKTDVKSKLIDNYRVTSAEVHDSQQLEDLLSEGDKGQKLYAGSAYIGEKIDRMLRSKQIESQIVERAFKGKQLTDRQKANNHEKSKIRCLCEHVFGFVTKSMNDFFIKSIGFQRAKRCIGLINLVYNMCRYEQIVRLDLLPIKKL